MPMAQEMIPEGMHCYRTVDEVIAAAVPHHVLPQLLRPIVTAMVPADAVRTRVDSLEEARKYDSTSVMIWPPSLDNTTEVADCFAALCSLPKCSFLTLTHCGVSPTAMSRSFASLATITVLDVRRCGSADSTFCEGVGMLQKLTSLSLCEPDSIDAAAFGAHIAPLPITSLSLIHCTKVGPSFYEPSRIGHMSKLRTLSLEGCRSLVWRLHYLTDTPVCHTLTALDLSGRYKVDDVTFDTVGTMTNLRALSLRHCDFIRDDDFESLHRLVHLEELDMGMWEWSDADTIHAVAQAFPALRRLNLLSNLTLRDDAVAALASIQSLEWVNLRNCSDVTEAAVSALRMQRTHLFIEK